MNKRLVEEFIPYAYDALKINQTICIDGKISGTLKGNIASFGAAVQMGSLLSAVAFFSQQGGATKPRQELLNIILQILKRHGDIQESEHTLFDYICKADVEEREGIKALVINAAIAVKLAMNLFEPEKQEKTEE